MENRSNFIPTPEFLKSEIGIPIKRNFPAGKDESILRERIFRSIQEEYNPVIIYDHHSGLSKIQSQPLGVKYNDLALKGRSET